MDNNKIYRRIITPGLALAAILLLIASVVLFYENRQLNSDLKKIKYTANNISSQPSLANVSSNLKYNGEPIDWEGGSAINYFACEADSDCIQVHGNSCYECDNDVSINKKYQERWQFRIWNQFAICDDGTIMRQPGESEEDYKARLPLPCRGKVVSKCVEKTCRLVLEK